MVLLTLARHLLRVNLLTRQRHSLCPLRCAAPRLAALIVHMKTRRHAQARPERRRADVSAPASSTAFALPQALQEFARSASSTAHDPGSKQSFSQRCCK